MERQNTTHTTCPFICLERQLTTAFVKSGLTTAEFIQHIINSRSPIKTEIGEEYSSITIRIDELTICQFSKLNDSNTWYCREWV